MKTHAKRDEFLRELRLEKKMREIAQVFIERVLLSRPALIDSDSSSQFLDSSLSPPASSRFTCVAVTFVRSIAESYLVRRSW